MNIHTHTHTYDVPPHPLPDHMGVPSVRGFCVALIARTQFRKRNQEWITLHFISENRTTTATRLGRRVPMNPKCAVAGKMYIYLNSIYVFLVHHYILSSYLQNRKLASCHVSQSPKHSIAFSCCARKLNTLFLG